MHRALLLWMGALGLASFGSACGRAEAHEPLRADAAVVVASASMQTALANAQQPPPAPPGPCASDMALIEGDYCPRVVQRCVKAGNVHRGDPSDHCKQYETARCTSKARQPLRFCMDRYEWPNQQGEKPLTLVSWHDARAHCATRGKRLCDADEFTFACEGEAMTAHVYGNTREPDKCHIDRPYVERTYTYKPYDECMANEVCRREYQRLDQRLPAGSRPECVNVQGVFDLNGNANEWVMVPGRQPPRRSGLKGGWWGPVRNRCRPLTTFHPEHDYGYEAGFRCCSDAG